MPVLGVLHGASLIAYRETPSEPPVGTVTVSVLHGITEHLVAQHARRIPADSVRDVSNLQLQHTIPPHGLTTVTTLAGPSAFILLAADGQTIFCT